MTADPFGAAAEWVRGGGLLAYPTESVWGLGADAVSPPALEGLRRWKRRGLDEPISILVEDLEALEALGFAPGERAARLAAAFWPGPLTLVLPCTGRFAPGVARADGAVGVRCSSHPVAAALARRLRAEGVGPITATSLNRSGEPAARSRDEAAAACRPAADAPQLLDVEGAEALGTGDSTVVDLTCPRPEVLRWGALGEAELDPVFRTLGAP